MNIKNLFERLILCAIGGVICFSLLRVVKSMPAAANSAYPPPEISAPAKMPNVPYPPPEPTLQPTDTPKPTIVAIEFDITFDGIDAKSHSELQLLPFTEQTKEYVSNLDIELPNLGIVDNKTERFNATLPVGVYKLTINSSPEYFRKPAGYLFYVSDEGIVRNSTLPFHFQLVAPSEQNLPPCRNIELQQQDNPVSDVIKGDIIDQPNVICRAEWLTDASSPHKNPEPNDILSSPLSTGYHYIGPRTYQDNKGVWGRNYVVDTGVNHTGNLGHFVAERVYANDSSFNNWMEAGWVERSVILEDVQYVYEYDSATNEWHYFENYPISPGMTVETRVYYNESISKWRALYYIGGSSWAILADESLGFTTASNGYNRGEVYNSDGFHPILPPSKFDKGYLLIDGVWRYWDDRYTTDIAEDEPYICNMHSEYNLFTIHSPVVYIPLVMKD